MIDRRLARAPRIQGKREIEADIAEILQQVHLLAHAGRVAKELAYGEQRQLELALALAGRPKILLLDEPTAGMSSAETERIGALIRRLAARTSVLLVEHDTEMVLGISDEVTVMTQGRLIAHGTPEAISRDPQVQDAYLGAVDARTLA